MYEIQRKAGRFFAHEHPSTATSWSLPCVLETLLKVDVNLVEVDMCNFSKKSSDAEGEGLVRKRTKILTNSQEVAKRVARRCTGDQSHWRQGQKSSDLPSSIQPSLLRGRRRSETITLPWHEGESHHEHR